MSAMTVFNKKMSVCKQRITLILLEIETFPWKSNKGGWTLQKHRSSPSPPLVHTSSTAHIHDFSPGKAPGREGRAPQPAQVLLLPVILPHRTPAELPPRASMSGLRAEPPAGGQLRGAGSRGGAQQDSDACGAQCDYVASRKQSMLQEMCS